MHNPAVIMLAELITATWDGKSPRKLYIFRPDGYHDGGVWFQDQLKYPDEEVTTEEAMRRAAEAIAKKLEVRICDGSDFLIFHSVNGVIVHDGITPKRRTN